MRAEFEFVSTVRASGDLTAFLSHICTLSAFGSLVCREDNNTSFLASLQDIRCGIHACKTDGSSLTLLCWSQGRLHNRQLDSHHNIENAASF